jgi:hypothetical protein
MGRDALPIPARRGGLADDPPGAVPVQPAAVRGQEHRAAGTLADGQVDRPGGPRRERDGDHLAALAGNGQGPVAALIGGSGRRSAVESWVPLHIDHPVQHGTG